MGLLSLLEGKTDALCAQLFYYMRREESGAAGDIFFSNRGLPVQSLQSGAAGNQAGLRHAQSLYHGERELQEFPEQKII